MQALFPRFFGNPRNQKILLLSVLFLSGLTALMYQIIWIKRFGLVFGTDIFSISTVLSAFMAGLALGSLFFGRLIDRVKRPLLVFFYIELGIGLFALAFPVLFDGLTGTYTWIGRNYAIGSYQLQLVKFLLSFVFLLVPTTLMGGTLPVIIKHFVRKLSDLGWEIGNMYAINNIGAVTGCFLAGFILIRAFGLSASLYIAASVNLLNALLAYFVCRSSEIRPPLPDSLPKKETVAADFDTGYVQNLSRPLVLVVLWVFAIEGFTTLAYEVVWSRILLGFSFDKTTYFYTTIIIAFIFGLSLGSYIIKRWVDRIRDLFGLLGIIEILIGIGSVALLVAFSGIAPELLRQRTIYSTWLGTSGKEYLVFFILLLFPTILMGMTFPIVGRLYNRNINNLGRRMGIIGFLDTAGSIFGAFVAGFILIPFAGVVRSFLFIAFLNILIGMVVILVHPRKGYFQKISTLAATGVLFVFLAFKIPGNQYFSWWDQLRYRSIWEHHYERVLYYEEGADATVSVREYPRGLSLTINGHNTAYTDDKDLRVHMMLAYLPYFIHPEPKNSMVIGFGMGVTVHSLVHPETETVDVAEISPGVVKAVNVFSPWNRNIIEQEKVNVYIEDGRGFLIMTGKKYDIITSNAIHPRLSNNIYTRDFYELCKSKLTANGIMAQWMPPNWLTSMEFRSLLKAFTDVFPNSSLWYINEGSTIIIGSKDEHRLDFESLVRRMPAEKVREDLESVGMFNPHLIAAQFVMDNTDLLNYTGDIPANTDDYPVVEYSRVINIAPDPDFLTLITNTPAGYGRILSEMEETESFIETVNKIEEHRKWMNYHIHTIVQTVRLYQERNK